MTTKRTPIRPAVKVKITPQALELYRKARRLLDHAPDSDAAAKASLALHVALGRAPWQRDVLDTISDEDEITEDMIAADREPTIYGSLREFVAAREIRRELERLHREEQ